MSKDFTVTNLEHQVEFLRDELREAKARLANIEKRSIKLLQWGAVCDCYHGDDSKPEDQEWCDWCEAAWGLNAALNGEEWTCPVPGDAREKEGTCE